METQSADINAVIKEFSSDINSGLSDTAIIKNREKFGKNVIPPKKKKSFIVKLLNSLSEPSLIILEFAWVITVGVNIGKFLKTGSCDVFECAGILFAILLSAFLTVFMEGKSEKAFETLGKTYDKTFVKCLRSGKILAVKREDIVVGDIVLLESGDKIAADGRLISSSDLKVDESTLTGESVAVRKDAEKFVKEGTPLAERANFVYSGTLIESGSGKMIVTAVGERAELGKLAGELSTKVAVSAPLSEKLTKLGKVITVIGGVSSALVFALSLIRLYLTGKFDFLSVQGAFVEAIVLIVAAVPEGLPTTAAISLSLNVLKLAKSNALIRKLVAAETVGSVSVICSDKTGTLTQNKMEVIRIIASGKESEKFILKNCAVNTTAVVKSENGKTVAFGSATERALVTECESRGIDYLKIRRETKTGEVLPFNSENKYMLTEDMGEGITYIKGAPEVIAGMCEESANKKILTEAAEHQEKSRRVIAFAHRTSGKFVFDGMAVIADPVRADVKAAVESCKSAGIDVKMLTGDNYKTAEAIARELGIIENGDEVITAAEIENLSEKRLIDLLFKVKVIARSTPATKLKVVEALKKAGEVVAVTGDGVNDAPAIKHADIGIAMGSGSAIAKEASDVVLLDDSFSTIVKAISFGRNIYRNFQRFIMFQLSVNLTAMIVVIASLILGLANPFNAMQLLWIDIIMDGPPALTLAMEKSGNSLMRSSPVKRTDSIVTKKMLLRIIAHSVLMGAAIIGEYLFDYIGAGPLGIKTAIFSLFVIFQLFNAFNCRKTGSESIFTGIGNNKPMVLTFGIVFLLQIAIVQVFPSVFGAAALSLSAWIRIVLTATLIIVFSETYKLFYRFSKKTAKNSYKLSQNFN